MNWNYVLIFTLVIAFFLLLIQRTEPSRRRLVTVIMIMPTLIIGYWASASHHETEAVVGLILALLLNLLFWILIGRYNPVASSNQIRVLRLDD